MSKDSKIYNENLANFAKAIANAFVTKLELDIDLTPSFDMKKIPFDFTYCHSVSLLTDKGNFKIGTSMTDDAIESLWIFPYTNSDFPVEVIGIKSKITEVAIHHGIDKLPCKIFIACEQANLTIYCGDIYDSWKGDFEYKYNDEMLLVFRDEKEAIKFEKCANYG